MEKPNPPQKKCRSRKEERPWRELFNAVNEAIFIHDAATGRILDVNDRMLEMYGFSREEAMQIMASDSGMAEGPYSDSEALAWIRKAVAEGPQLFEWRSRRKNGETFWSEVSLRTNRNGDREWVVAVVRDISKRKRAEEDLLESENRYRALFERSLDCVFLADCEGNFLDVNQAALDLLGYTHEEIPSLNYRTVLSEDQLPLAFQTTQEVMATGNQKQPVEFRLRRRDGTEVYAEVQSSLIFRHGKPYAVQGVARDTTRQRQATEAMRLAHQRERLHFDQTPLGVVEWDLDFRVTSWNPAAERVFGYTAEEALGQHASFIVPPAVRPHVDELWNKLLARRGGERSTNENLHKDSRSILCEWYNTPLVDQHGSVIGVASLVMDVTDRRRAEKQLQDSERLYHSLVENLPQSIFRKDLSGCFTFANKQFCRSLNRSLEDILGKTDADFCPPDLAARYRRDDARVIETGHSIEQEDEYEAPDRSRRVVWVVKTPLRDAHNQIIGVQGIFWDITQLKRAEEAVAEREKRYRSLFELSPTGILLEDASGNILEVNDAMCRIFGYTREELCGRNVRVLVAQENQAVVDRHIEELLAGKTLLHEVDNVDKDGRRRRVELHEMSVPLPDGRRGILAVVNDITQRRQLEEQLRHLQKMESVGQLAAGVAHDFNNILTVINGSASILTEILANQPECNEWLTQIAMAGERAANLTRQLLLFSRKQQLNPTTVNLNELTSNLTKMLCRLLGEHITLEFSYENDLPAIQGDTGMLEQVIINLAVNARDAMPQGGRLQIATSSVHYQAVPASVNPAVRPGTFVRLAICDTGSGIPAEIRERIFEPFFTTKEVGRGTGLGLATVFGIVTQHEGWIEVKSNIGQGTTFLIHLPASPIPEAKRPASTVNLPALGHGENILVVEDEDSVRELMSRTLARHGYVVTVAHSGAEARQLPPDQLRHVDVLITDMVMPGGVSGRDLAESLRLAYPRLRVIYCSGYSPEITGGWLALDRSATFIQKPFTSSEFLNAVADSLRD